MVVAGRGYNGVELVAEMLVLVGARKRQRQAKKKLDGGRSKKNADRLDINERGWNTLRCDLHLLFGILQSKKDQRNFKMVRELLFSEFFF